MSGLPPGWIEARLSDVVENLDSMRVPVNQTGRAKRPGAVPYFGATGQVGWIDEPLFDEELCLVGEDGAPFLDRDKPKAYLISGPSWVNNHAHVLRASGATSNRFIAYVLNWIDYRPYVNGTTRLKLTKGAMSAIPVPVPPLNEQRRIVAAIEEQFSRLDAADESLRRAGVGIPVLREGVYAAAIFDESPKAKLGELLREPLRNGHSAKALRDGEVRTLTLTAVTRGEFTDENTKLTGADPVRVENLWLEPGDVFIERSNTPELVGTAALYRGAPRWAIFPDLLIRIRVVDRLLPEFLEILLKSRPARRYFQAAAQGIAGSMPKIDQGAVERLDVPVPPLEEQRRIVAEVEQRLSVVDALRDAVEGAQRRSAALRRLILERAFRGELVLQDPSDEPAPALLERIRAAREAAAQKPRGGQSPT